LWQELRHCSEQLRNSSSLSIVAAHPQPPPPPPLEFTVPDYFAAAVLRRSSPDFPSPAFGNPKFQVGFFTNK